MCQECGCFSMVDDEMPVLDMSYLWQDGQFYWDRGDGHNVPIHELSDEFIEAEIHFLADALRRYKDTYDEAEDVFEVFPDPYKAALLNSMDQVAAIVLEFLKDSHRRQRRELING